TGARRQHRHDAIVKSRQAHAVALAVHEVRERRRQTLAVLILRDPARAVRHRAADVEHHVAVEVRLLLKLFDVVASASSVDLPVNRREIIAGNVLTVFRELDAESFERTAVQAREESFDDRTSLELQIAQARNDRRVEKLAFARSWGHGYIPLFGSGTVSRRRATMVSELMRSDSA